MNVGKMNKMEKFKNLVKLSATVKDAAADGKITVLEMIKIAFAAFPAVKELAALKAEMRLASKDDIAKIFGAEAGIAGQLIAHISGIYSHAAQLVALCQTIEVPKKKAEKKETVKAPENE